ncbi:hypothetical protein [Streptomyces sp. GbtcB6]|uniref:hypothetical protein n=1 Tax=Streptomyces sp. GbtcB6 TaxID=2824751 RepID=UPI001C2F7D53|nr:hypothetical protein [Streptomyces sp. GbtcB6]
MRTRPLGTGGPRVAPGPQVAPPAPGCAGMSDGTAPADEADAVATIRTALDTGVTLLGTDYVDVHRPARRPHRVEEAVPADAVAGTRYAAPLIALLDSERGPRPQEEVSAS